MPETPEPVPELGSSALAALVTAVKDAVAEAISKPLPLTFNQPDAIAYVGISRSAWFRLKSAGLLPPSIRLEGCAECWRRADLNKFIEQQKGKRR